MSTENVESPSGRLNPAVVEAPVGTALSSAPWPHPRQAWYAVFVFALALMINFLDRGILTLLVPPIKRDLHLSDTQVSLIMGFAFACFYMLLGVPIARLVDVGRRKLILSAGVAVWSVMTAACGLAGNFWQLFAARIGVGAGEACNGPGTFSMLADFFPKDKLPRAIAVLNFGYMAGNGFALIIGGTVIYMLSSAPEVTIPLLGTFRSWQAVLFAVGLPGLVVSGLLLTVKEPPRRGLIGEAGARGQSIPFRNVLGFVHANRAAYYPMFLGLGLKTILSFGSAVWVPSFYMRTFGWSATQVGLVTGVLILVVWPFGAMFGSWLSERWTRLGRDDANMRVVVASVLVVTPCSILFPLAPTVELALAVATLNGFAAAWVLGPQNAALQVITPNQMRGQVTAIFLFFFNVIGFGFGPTFVALITDHVFKAESHLNLAMSTAAAILGPMALVVIWSGLKSYGRAVEQAKGWN